MAPDAWTKGRTDGHGQTYIPPPSAGDKITQRGMQKLSILHVTVCFAYLYSEMQIIRREKIQSKHKIAAQNSEVLRKSHYKLSCLVLADCKVS